MLEAIRKAVGRDWRHGKLASAGLFLFHHLVHIHAVICLYLIFAQDGHAISYASVECRAKIRCHFA